MISAAVAGASGYAGGEIAPAPARSPADRGRASSPRTPRPGSGWATSIRTSLPLGDRVLETDLGDDPARPRRRLPRPAARRVRRAGRPAARGHRRRRLRRRLPAHRCRGVAGVLRHRARRHLALRAAGAADPRRRRPGRAEGRHPDRRPRLLPDRLSRWRWRPGFAAGLLEPQDVVVVAASGTSGAGRGLKPHLLGSEVMGVDVAVRRRRRPPAHPRDRAEPRRSRRASRSRCPSPRPWRRWPGASSPPARPGSGPAPSASACASAWRAGLRRRAVRPPAARGPVAAHRGRPRRQRRSPPGAPSTSGRPRRRRRRHRQPDQGHRRCRRSSAPTSPSASPRPPASPSQESPRERHSPAGFRAAGVTAGLKASGKPDVALVVNDGPDHHAAAVFTSNRVEAAPVRRGRARSSRDGASTPSSSTPAGPTLHRRPGLPGHAPHRRAGRRGARTVGRATSRSAPPGSSASCCRWTRSRRASTTAAAALATDGHDDAAAAIMTTDTVPRAATFQGDGWSVGGMAKGAGMLAPALATMLVVAHHRRRRRRRRPRHGAARGDAARPSTASTPTAAVDQRHGARCWRPGRRRCAVDPPALTDAVTAGVRRPRPPAHRRRRGRRTTTSPSRSRGAASRGRRPRGGPRGRPQQPLQVRRSSATTPTGAGSSPRSARPPPPSTPTTLDVSMNGVQVCRARRRRRGPVARRPRRPRGARRRRPARRRRHRDGLDQRPDPRLRPRELGVQHMTHRPPGRPRPAPSAASSTRPRCASRRARRRPSSRRCRGSSGSAARSSSSSTAATPWSTTPSSAPSPQDVAFLRYAGLRPVVVHGGGPQIAPMLDRLGLDQRVQGRACG